MPDPVSKIKEGGISKSKVIYSSAGSSGIQPRTYTFNSGNIRDQLTSVQKKVDTTKFDRVKHKDTKRSHIALVFVYGYMAMVAIIVIGGPLYNALVLQNPVAIDIERILAQIGSLIGAPLGFVIGYYFKEDK